VSPARRWLGHLGTFCAEDARNAPRDTIVNHLAGSTLMPRVLRFAIYRATGLKIGTPNIRRGVFFLDGRKVRIGRGGGINYGCLLEAVGTITIGDESVLGPQVTILTSDHPRDAHGHWDRTQSVGNPVTIGERCWIGARSTILPGVTIGDDVIVAAGAVVTKDCASNGLYAGVPARRIKELGAAAAVAAAQPVVTAVADVA
jgi:acetyltransferase-like isoleucine patch superfamily enzyme